MFYLFVIIMSYIISGMNWQDKASPMNAHIMYIKYTNNAF